MPSIFDRVRANNPRSSVFDLTHERKFSCDFGSLIPTYIQDVIPGDNFRVNQEMLVRLQPLIAPVMHRCDVTTHFFFVPNRLVWSGWEDFITGGRLGTDTSVPPQFNIRLSNSLDAGALVAGALPDFMGVPTVTGQAAGVFQVSELPFRAYQLIYNEYYRDQNLMAPLDLDKEIGGSRNLTSDIVNNLLTLRNRCWERDYFTSALPWTQRGDEVTIPLGTSAPVSATDPGTGMLLKTTGGAVPANSILRTQNGTGQLENQTPQQLVIADGQLEADLTNATAATINDLRTAFQVQKFKERSARAGNRYIESILAHFGVISPDARLQRPEYLGGGKSPITISEVLQTSGTTDPDATDPLYNSPQGNMSGHGISVGNTHAFSKRFTEHGYIIGITSIKERTAYFQGLPRHLTRTNMYEYYWPEFANLGEQEVLNRELFLDPEDSGTTNNGTFGYQSRYAEYRYVPSSVHGDFRTSLLHWHMGRKFDTTPELNMDFVTVDRETSDRTFAVQDVNHCLVQLVNNVRAIRPIPRMAEPGFIDH